MNRNKFLTAEQFTMQRKYKFFKFGLHSLNNIKTLACIYFELFNNKNY